MTGIQRNCEECVYLSRGICALNGSDVCTCFQGYESDFCRESAVVSILQSSPSTNWTVPVAVVSAVAGLLLIIALVMIILFCISRRRRLQDR